MFPGLWAGPGALTCPHPLLHMIEACEPELSDPTPRQRGNNRFSQQSWRKGLPECVSGCMFLCTCITHSCIYCVSTNMCMFVCICAHPCMCVSMFSAACIQACVTYTCVSCPHMCMCLHLHNITCALCVTCTCVCPCIHVYMYGCMHLVCLCVHLHVPTVCTVSMSACTIAHCILAPSCVHTWGDLGRAAQAPLTHGLLNGDKDWEQAGSDPPLGLPTSIRTSACVSCCPPSRPQD